MLLCYAFRIRNSIAAKCFFEAYTANPWGRSCIIYDVCLFANDSKKGANWTIKFQSEKNRRHSLNKVSLCRFFLSQSHSLN